MRHRLKEGFQVKWREERLFPEKVSRRSLHNWRLAVSACGLIELYAARYLSPPVTVTAPDDFLLLIVAFLIDEASCGLLINNLLQLTVVVTVINFTLMNGVVRDSDKFSQKYQGKRWEYCTMEYKNIKESKILFIAEERSKKR